MRCPRCNGFIVHDEWRSEDNDFRVIAGIRCVNCGFSQFNGADGSTGARKAVKHEETEVVGSRGRRRAAKAA